MGVKVDNFDSRVETLEQVIAKKVKTINGLITRNGGRGLINILLEYIRAIRPRASKSVVKQVVCFVFSIAKIYKHSKLKGVVIYLKACQVLLQQSVGGFRVSDLSELKVRPKRTRSGLPRIIPAGARRLIVRDRHIPTIRLWMTLFGLFRILEFKGKLSFSTITDPGSIKPGFQQEWDKWLDAKFVPLISKKYKLGSIQSPTIFPILKGGPTTESGAVNTSPFSLIWSARILIRSTLKEAFKTFSSQIEASSFYNRIQVVAMATHSTLDRYEIWAKLFIPAPKGKGYLGKLGFKIEPAGKIRVFAMVDSWTQWLLYPLHNWIFALLAQIKSDGTFNQLRPVLRLQKLFYPSKVKARTFSSIDLSAATDRLPISLQVSLLRSLLKDLVPDSALFAEAWRSILVDRPYSISLSNEIKKGAVLPKTVPKDIMYTVGQPMGALSSWGMLALTHHAIVQFSANKAGIKGWFSDYAVLGDDIVIANGKVAHQYKLLLQNIGVKAGLAKSIIARSKFVLEFAKKFFVDSTTANMLPIKECIATRCSTSLVLEFVRKYELSLNQTLAFLGFGYKARSKAFSSDLFDLSTRLRVLLVWLSFPKSPLSRFVEGTSEFPFSHWLFMKSWTTIHVPAEELIWELAIQVAELALQRQQRISQSISKYSYFAKSEIDTFDKKEPILVKSTYGSSQTNPMEEITTISWSKIIGTSLKEDIPLDYSTTTFRSFKRAHQPTLELDPVPFDLLEKWTIESVKPLMNFKSDMFNGYENGESAISFLERYLNLLFKSTVLDSIPSKFWPDARKEPRAFKDFLEIYKMWQDLSRAIWASYYKEKGRKPTLGKQEGSRRSRALVPVSGVMTLIEIPFGCRRPNGVLPVSFSSYVERAIPNRYVYAIGRYIDDLLSLYLSRFVLIITRSLYTTLIILLLASLFLSSDYPIYFDELAIPREQEVVITGRHYLWFSIGILICILIFGLLGLSWDFSPITWDNSSQHGFIDKQLEAIVGEEIANPHLGLDTTFLDPITRFQRGIPGPYSPSELSVLQDYLEVKAFMDNLSISPIGELWPEQ